TPRMCVKESVIYPEAYPISGRPPIWNGVQLSYGSGGRLPRAKGQLSLRVFGRLPVTARGAARRQASEKPRRRKPRGEYAPAAVSVYRDLTRGSARLGRSRTELPSRMGSGVGDFGSIACRGRRAGRAGGSG